MNSAIAGAVLGLALFGIFIAIRQSKNVSFSTERGLEILGEIETPSIERRKVTNDNLPSVDENLTTS